MTSEEIAGEVGLTRDEVRGFLGNMENLPKSPEQAQAYFERYKTEVQGMVNALFDIGQRADLDGFNWLVDCFVQACELTKAHIDLVRRTEAPDLIREEKF